MHKLILCVLASLALVGSWAPELEAQCNHCVEYFSQGQFWHYFDLGEPPPLPNDYDGSHTNVVSGTCDVNHSSCEELVAQTLEELPPLLQDPSSLARAVRNSEQIVFDWTSATVAILDCDGNSVWETPLGLREWFALLLQSD